MSARTTAALRSESLAATIAAAQGRRFRRRARGAVLSLIVIAACLSPFLQNKRTKDSDGVLPPLPGPSPALAEKVTPSPVPRITTASHPPVERVTTSPTARVERISGTDLAQLFPDQEIILVGENAFAATFGRGRDIQVE